jgi:hypothetical protein
MDRDRDTSGQCTDRQGLGHRKTGTGTQKNRDRDTDGWTGRWAGSQIDSKRDSYGQGEGKDTDRQGEGQGQNGQGREQKQSWTGFTY